MCRLVSGMPLDILTVCRQSAGNLQALRAWQALSSLLMIVGSSFILQTANCVWVSARHCAVSNDCLCLQEICRLRKHTCCNISNPQTAMSGVKTIQSSPINHFYFAIRNFAKPPDRHKKRMMMTLHFYTHRYCNTTFNAQTKTGRRKNMA